MWQKVVIFVATFVLKEFNEIPCYRKSVPTVDIVKTFFLLKCDSGFSNTELTLSLCIVRSYFLSNFDQNRTRSYINNDRLQEFILKEVAVSISVDSSVPAILPLGVRIQNTISLLFPIDMDILVAMASWKPRFGPFLEQKMYFACPFH